MLEQFKLFYPPTYSCHCIQMHCWIASDSTTENNSCSMGKNTTRNCHCEPPPLLLGGVAIFRLNRDCFTARCAELVLQFAHRPHLFQNSIPMPCGNDIKKTRLYVMLMKKRQFSIA